MSGRPHRAVSAIRYAVRAALSEIDLAGNATQDLVLAACSGGADSVALADALAYESRKAGRRGGAVIVDHGLQPGSSVAAEAAAALCRDRGLDPVEVVVVSVCDHGDGPEGAARAARYAALSEAADRLGATAVLLGHTRNDQAEQVLLGLVRGSGTRSLAGMPRARGIFHRPLLGISREDTEAACRAEGLPIWQDPMNDDAAFTRVRARRALADLEADLGPGVVAALARTADQLRVDAELLEELTTTARAALGATGPFPVQTFAAVPPAVRTRVWRTLLVEAGAPASALGTRHTDACDRLLTHWRGQGPLHLPGDLRVSRVGGGVHIAAHRQVE